MFITMLLMFIVTHLFRIFFKWYPGLGGFSLFSFMAATVLVGTLVSFILSRIPMRPVESLVNAIDNLAKGDFSTRIYLRGPDVFNTLTNSFNHMAHELESTEMLRSDFVNNLSHEFKTPIVSIQGFAKILKNDDLTQAQRTEYLDIIITESERLTDLSTNILNLSSLEHQRILKDVTPFNLTEQIRLIIVLLENRWEPKQLTLDFDSDEITIEGNEEMLKQVWINVLTNAIKFAPKGSEIKIEITHVDAMVSVLISNSGEPIPFNVWNRVFEKFYQSDRSRTTEGNGLGLPLAKRIVDLHQGTIRIKQSNEDITIFEVKLPINIKSSI